MDAKLLKIFKTKTLWVNILLVVLEFVNQANGAVIDAKTSAIIVMVVNTLLRLLTNKPVTEK